MVLQWKSTFLECRGLASRNQLCIVRSMSGGDFTALFKFDARDSRLWLWLRLKDPENWPKLENSQRKKGRLRGPDASLPLWCHTRSELGSVSHGLRYKDARSVMRPYFIPLFSCPILSIIHLAPGISWTSPSSSILRRLVIHSGRQSSAVNSNALSSNLHWIRAWIVLHLLVPPPLLSVVSTSRWTRCPITSCPPQLPR